MAFRQLLKRYYYYIFFCMYSVHKFRMGCFPKYNCSVNYVCQIGAQNLTKKIMATNGLKWKQLTRQTCRVFANKTARNNIQHNFRLSTMRTNTQTAHAGLCNILIIIK